MEIKFNPLDPQDVAVVESLLKILHNHEPAVVNFRHPQESQFTHTGAEPQFSPATFAADPAPVATEGPQSFHYSEGAVPELDAAGIPWNGDVHSSSKKKNADQSWSIKRNCPPHLADAYKVNFKSRQAAQAPAEPQWQTGPAPADLNAHFGAPPVTYQAPALPQPAAFHPAPEIDYPTFGNAYMALWNIGKLDDPFIAEMFKASSVHDMNGYINDGRARQIAYGMLKQRELA